MRMGWMEKVFVGWMMVLLLTVMTYLTGKLLGVFPERPRYAALACQCEDCKCADKTKCPLLCPATGKGGCCVR